MRYWNTGDEVTDSNLGFLENLARPWPGITPDQFTERVCQTIKVLEMLPKAVKRHLQLPSLDIGNAAFGWKAEQLNEENLKLCLAIEDGLAQIHADPDLQRGGEANLSDRPRSRGEDLLAALAVYKRSQSDADFHALQILASGGSIGAAIRKLGDARKRKRPMGSLSIEQEQLRAIDGIEFYASRFHYERSHG